jgi:hypothetical protein
MKLSEAMRKGAAKSTPGQGQLVDKNGACCALGAVAKGTFPRKFMAYAEFVNDTAYRGCSPPPFFRMFSLLQKKYPELIEHTVDGNILWDVIVTMNDCEKRSREEIADWLESLGM